MPCAWLQGQPADNWFLKFRPILHPKHSQDGVELAWRLVTIQFILEIWKGVLSKLLWHYKANPIIMLLLFLLEAIVIDADLSFQA